MAETALPQDTLKQSNRLFRVYNHYRIVVGIVIVGFLYFDIANINSEFYNLLLYQVSSFTYLAINIFVGLILLAGLQLRQSHIALSLVFDILAFHLLLASSIGVASGLANLIIISVAAANIVLVGRIATFMAALATLLTLSTEIAHILLYNKNPEGMFQAGLLGVIYFAIAFLLQAITKRVASSEKLAEDRAQNIAELERLNHQIIQRMQTGIIVSDDSGAVRLSNEAARAQLRINAENQQPLKVLPEPLAERLQQWRRHPSQRTETFRCNPGLAPIQANFTSLKKGAGDEILIFLDDTSKIAQQAQQMKLASLGRLTAGIAHEIRNPLGAISHAAQLLAESPDLNDGDRRMNEIIQRHSVRMNGIIENVLQLSRRRQPETELLDLNIWIDQFIHDFTAAGTTSAQINLDPSPLKPVAKFDPSQLHQIMTNLVANGLRYSKQESGQEVLYIQTGISEEEDRAYVDIIDEGKGVDEADALHIFEPFFTTEKTGTGLGLYLSRELCEANQAQIDYRPAVTGGSCFRISFAHHKRIT